MSRIILSSLILLMTLAAAHAQPQSTTARAAFDNEFAGRVRRLIEQRRYDEAIATCDEALRRDDHLLMVVVPATSRVNVPWVRRAVGAKHARLATESEFLRAFPDCEAGAMPPFGNLYHLPVLVDRGLTRDPVIIFNGGTHDLVVTMTYEDFARLVQPKVGIFAVQP